MEWPTYLLSSVAIVVSGWSAWNSHRTRRETNDRLSASEKSAQHVTAAEVSATAQSISANIRTFDAVVVDLRALARGAGYKNSNVELLMKELDEDVERVKNVKAAVEPLVIATALPSLENETQTMLLQRAAKLRGFKDVVEQARMRWPDKRDQWRENNRNARGK